MEIPTEPIGSIPRPLMLREALRTHPSGTDPCLEPLYEDPSGGLLASFVDLNNLALARFSSAE
jgi:hypothetical protein